MKPKGMSWSQWILECGCEPCIEHCEQCDERRKQREKAEHQEYINWLIAELTSCDTSSPV